MELLYRIDQSLNIPGVLYALRTCTLDMKKLIPHMHYKNINSLEPEFFRQIGIKGVIFDKDNTLANPYAYSVHPEIENTFKTFKEVYGSHVAIISNSAGIPSDKKDEKARRIEKAFGVRVIRHKKKKPEGIEDILKYFGLEDASQLMIVGDRVLTDIAFGNRYGMLTVLVDPFTLKGDNLGARLVRPFERGIMHWAKRKYGKPEYKGMRF